MAEDYRVTQHFWASEIRCHCGCGLMILDTDHLHRMQALRNYLNIPLVCTSWCRCHEYNKKVGGVDNSRHLKGEATDIKVVNDRTRFNIVKGAIALRFGGIGLDSKSGFIHLDSRPAQTGAIWTY